MRTVFVHSGNMYGGVERVLEVIGGPFGAPLGPRFALCFDGKIASDLRQLGAHVDLLGSVRMTRPDRVLSARRRLAAYLAAESPDAVVMPSVWTHVVFAPVVVRAGLPLVLWVHDVLSPSNWLERLAQRTPPDLIVCNSIVSERAASAVFPEPASTVVHCPLTFDTPSTSREEVRRALGVTADTRVIVSIGRMEPYKGHRVLIDALAQLGSSVDWCWWCVGGPQRPHEEAYFRQLQTQTRAAGLTDRVRFLGSRNDVANLLGAADLFCHPNSGVEPFGLVVIEALQAGLPVVASRLGGPAEIVTDACGFLVEPGNTSALAGALGTLLEKDEARRTLGAGGPARATALCDAASRVRDLVSAIELAIRVRCAA